MSQLIQSTKNIITNSSTYDELVNELKSNEKYQEWVLFGSKFGLIDKRTSDPFRIKYIYSDMYGNNITVSEITNIYRQNIINIPVYKYIGRNTGTLVEQSKFKIIDTDNTLSTAGLATCSGLSMTFGTKKFLAHLDATTSTSPIVKAITNSLYEQNITSDNITNICIYAGYGLGGGSETTVQIAFNICQMLNINKSKVNVSKVFYMNRIII